MKKFALAASAALIALSAATPAMAARMFTLTATGSSFNIDATLTTTDSSDNVGYSNNTGYLITGITGTVKPAGNGNNVQTINGLSAVGTYPVDGVVSNDNILKTTAPYFDLAGVSFTTAQGGSPFNLYYDGGYLFIRGRNQNNTGSFTSVTISEITAAVPEPATWAMMLVGFGMVAGAARYRRRSTKAAYA
ncbi:PEPxxWA-CTERM sorting domain-containing protein [Sphingomonas sp. KR1UV-12]|uniref:PEPxxWA-CTERM sorting domain-containing protein n=1 Tax=Sphingomonas aurea TaxID=3063994 RepID=A0ABT9EKD1_9SPHN|nr:PEPxxWA-CTERM sorting domain-containing protein [Sphingomonas sp. KR1UV-12]MDP1027068.1 PEPxxWA-CTERM sorting domain-containing protein [Sphingomonas sp. KR1UV-12]